MIGVGVSVWSPAIRRKGGGGAPALTQNVRVLFIGDSQTAGVGADPTGNSDINGARPYSFPLQAADWLTDNGVPTISQSVCGDNNVGQEVWHDYRPDITVTGTYSNSSRNPTAGGLLPRQVNGSALSFTTTVPVDTLEFAIPRVGAFGSIALDIDGAPQGTYSQVNATDDYVIRTVTGLTLAAHTFTFKEGSGAVHGPGFINAWDSSAKAVQILNAGARNWTTENWNLATYGASPLNAIATLYPDIVVIKLGTNDWRQGGTTIAQTTSRMQALIDAAEAAGAVVLLVVPEPIANYNETTDAWSQDAVLGLHQNLATTNGLTLIDSPQLYYDEGLSGATEPADYASMDALGHYYNSLHANGDAYEVQGNAVGASLKTIIEAQGWLA